MRTVELLMLIQESDSDDLHAEIVWLQNMGSYWGTWEWFMNWH